VKKGDKLTVGQVVLTVDDGAGAAASASATSAPAEASSSAPAAAPAAAPAPAPAAAPAAPAAAPAAAPEPRPADLKVISMPARAPAEPPPAPAARSGRGPAPASPGVRRLAREIGVDVHEVAGTGPGGRITQEDVKEHARRILASVGSTIAAAAVSPARTARPLPDFQKWGTVDRQPWSNIRRATSEHLSHAWTTIPHVTQFDKADFTAMEELRKKYKDQVAAAGGSLTVTAILVKVLAAAVQKFPQFNASVDTERGEIVYKKYVNVGVAVDTDRGLLVPVIRGADTKNITRLAVELNDFAARARDRKLTPDDMSGGGITISNLGGIGGTHFTPIVNWPEVAILGVSRGVIEPVWRPAPGGREAGAPAGSFEPRLMLPLSLSYDHRVIDGADAMRFLRWVVEAIEHPFLLSLIG
jgi:pyruvate dehydrogenase E2 component (dihydrolipoamide acetyltransferase)